MSDRGIRILVIDGEGSPTIGVVPSIRVLDEMMSRIAFDEDQPQESILPCDYFDLIVGSGDGGWIALMLGRLGMPASRVKTAYEEIHTYIHRDCANFGPEAKAGEFEKRLKKLVCEETQQTDAELEKLQDSKTDQPRCKVAVLTKASLNIGVPIILRTYRVRDNQTENCPVWAAIRACTARVNVFPPANLSGQTLISASLGDNNPIFRAMEEALVAFPNTRIDCVISIGSGHPGHSELQQASSNSLAKAAMELAQNSESVSQEFAKRRNNEGYRNSYFRFNVQQGLQAYVQAGYDAALTHTKAYLKDTAVGASVNTAINELQGGRTSDLSLSQTLPVAKISSSAIIHASNAPPIQTYAYALYQEGLGLPLWDPQPLYESKPVEIGDVGILTKFGGFRVLFNATLPAERQKTMGYRIPPSFEPISIDSSEIELDPDVLRVPYLAHGDVIPGGRGLDSVATSQSKVQKPFKLSFAAMNGAALVLEDRPTEVSLAPERRIERYITENCRAWYHYYEHDSQGPERNFHGASLIFVTSVVQNSRWALGAWSSLGKPIEVSYSGSVTTSGGKFLDIAGRWTPSGRRDVKQGPTSTRGQPRPKLRQEDDPKKILSPLTQTLFVRGYVVGVRDTRPENLEPSKVYPLPYKSWWDFLRQIFAHGIPTILRAAAEPQDLPPPSPPTMAPAVLADESSIDENTIITETTILSPPRQIRHPADDIIDNIFKIDPSRSVIVLHDDTIRDLMRSTNGQQTENRSLSHSLSEKNRFRIDESNVFWNKQVIACMNLPNDLLLHIFSFCDAQTVGRLRHCSKHFYELSMDQVVWLEVLKTTCADIGFPAPFHRHSKFSTRDIELFATTWIRFQLALRNAKDGNPVPHQIVRQIDIEGHVYSLDQSWDGRFLFAAHSGGLGVWNLQTVSPTLVCSFEMSIPEDSRSTLVAPIETENSCLVYLLINSESTKLDHWLAFRFYFSSTGCEKHHLYLLSELDRLAFSAEVWDSWATDLIRKSLIMCFTHSSLGKHYVVWDAVVGTCASWTADKNDASTDSTIFLVNGYIIALDNTSHAMAVYSRPDIPLQSSYAPEVCAKLNNPAQLYIPGETGMLNNQMISTMYWQTYPNRGRPSSDLEGFSQIYSRGEENWFLDRFEIVRADPPSSIFMPLPLNCERSSFQYSHPLPIREGRVGFADVFIDQRLLLHCPSRDWTQVVFHLSSPAENNGGAEVGRGVLYDSGGSFELGSRDYSLSAFAGRMCIYALGGIEIVDFVESPYLKDIQTV